MQTGVGWRDQRRVEESAYAATNGESMILRLEMLPAETTIKVTLSFGGAGSHLRSGAHEQNGNRAWTDPTDP